MTYSNKCINFNRRKESNSRIPGRVRMKQMAAGMKGPHSTRFTTRRLILPPAIHIGEDHQAWRFLVKKTFPE